MKIIRVIHYDETDTDFGGDYFSIELKTTKGKVVATFGDAYHDKGWEQADGFVAGIEWATGKKVTVITQKVADGQT